MKVNWKLWPLAFAAAAFVGCTDDDDMNGTSNGNGNELSGPTAYMKVTVNQGQTTRASGGEEGDTDNGETGSGKEYTVNDITVILFDKGGDEVSLSQFTGDSKIVGYGFEKTTGMQIGSEDWHDRTATVTIKLTENPESFDGKTYGVITVANLGENNGLLTKLSATEGKISTGAQLANYLQANAYSEAGGKYSKFIMSTHNDQYGQSAKIFDKVTLVANATADNAPQADVHVERLAAKIRINEYKPGGVSNNFIYTVGSGDAEAKVRLEKVAVVNQLNSGTYLLKRVTENTTLGTEATGDIYLGNETADSDGAGTNYVIDPWTRNKNQAGLNNITSIDGAGSITTMLAYKNAYSGTTTTIGEKWNDDFEKKALTGEGVSYPLTLAYTQENTAGADMQKNGYSTGALFQATYFPKKWGKTNAEGTKVEAAEIDYNGTDNDGSGYDAIGSSTTVPQNFKFYVYDNAIYADMEAVFNVDAFTAQSELDGVEGANIYKYSSFTSSNITSVGKKAFFESPLCKYAADPTGYIAYLKKKCDADENGELDSDITESSMFESTDAISTYESSDDGKTAIAENIKVYDKGVCYYPYWIRHADNGKPNEMGVMEFAIVRNNIYDLTVTGISKLGLSGADVPEPGKDNESKEVYFKVVVNVKNWVVRSNGGIIL